MRIYINSISLSAVNSAFFFPLAVAYALEGMMNEYSWQREKEIIEQKIQHKKVDVDREL